MNLYITPGEIKADLQDMIQSTTTKYDDVLYRRCREMSRGIDRRCKRFFYPLLTTKYFSIGPNPHRFGTAQVRPLKEHSSSDAALLGILWVPDLISVTAIYFSTDNGATYTALAETDYVLAVGEDFDKPCSYNTIILDVNGEYSAFPAGQRSVKITGVWGYVEDRDACWEDSGITLAGNMAVDATTFTVADADAEDLFGSGISLQIGRLIKIGDEYLVVTAVDAVTDMVTVRRPRNGTTAAAHNTGDAVYLWRPPAMIVDAARMMVVKEFLNSQQGYASRGGEELGGQVRYSEYMDRSVMDKLAPFIKMAVG